MTSYGSYIVETLVTLAGVSLLAFVLLYAARRMGIGRPVQGGNLALVGRLPLDSRRSVVLVRVATQVYVLGVSEAGLTKLGEMSAADLPPQVDEPAPAFADVLRRAFARHRSSKSPSIPPRRLGDET